MKIVKYIFLFIVLAILVVLGIGMLTEAVDYESEITVNKSAAEAWAVMSDESNISKWIEGYVKSELVSGTANTVGAVSNVYVNPGGEEMVMKETITESIPNKKMAMTFEMGPMDMDYEMTFTEQGDNTIIRSKSVTRGSGIMMKSMLLFMKGSMQEQENSNLNSLKKLIDENTKDYF